MFTSLIYLNYLLVAVILAAMIWFILNQRNDVNNHTERWPMVMVWGDIRISMIFTTRQGRKMRTNNLRWILGEAILVR